VGIESVPPFFELLNLGTTVAEIEPPIFRAVVEANKKQARRVGKIAVLRADVRHGH